MNKEKELEVMDAEARILSLYIMAKNKKEVKE